MVGREDDGIWVTLKEIVHAAPSEVTSCVATASGLCRWLAVLAEYDSEAGGNLAISWDRDWLHESRVRVLSFDCNRSLDGYAHVRWEWFPSPLDETSVPVDITVTPLPEHGAESGGSRVLLRHGPFRDDVESLLTMADSAESWRWYLCNLRSVLETKHDMRAVRPL